jgi:hypothetical protein
MIFRPQVAARPVPSFAPRSRINTVPSVPDSLAVIGYRFIFKISGNPLVVASATLRIRSIDQSDCFLTLAGVPSIDLSELIGSEVTFTVREQLTDLSLRDTELFMFYFKRTDISETINDYIVEISGSRKLTYGNPQTVELDSVLNQSSTSSSQRWRIPMRKDLKPGDTLLFQSASLTINELSYFIGPQNSYLEARDG